MPAKNHSRVNGGDTSDGKAPAEVFTDAIGASAEHSYEAFQSAIQNWLAETQRFQEEMFAQGATALEQLRACRSPLDVLSVEQEWLTTRSKAYLDAGPRFGRIFAAVAKDLQPTSDTGNRGA